MAATDTSCTQHTSSVSGLYDLYYDYDTIPIDCSTALSDVGFANPGTISYVDGGADQ